jgi:hypothetical protein
VARDGYTCAGCTGDCTTASLYADLSYAGAFGEFSFSLFESAAANGLARRGNACDQTRHFSCCRQRGNRPGGISIAEACRARYGRFWRLFTAQ